MLSHQPAHRGWSYEEFTRFQQFGSNVRRFEEKRELFKNLDARCQSVTLGKKIHFIHYSPAF